MTKLMMGNDVAKAMKERLIQDVEALKANGVNPCLSIIRVGERPDDLAYERGAKKRMELVGITCKTIELSEDISQKELEDAIQKANEDTKIHGILMFSPLPGTLNEEKARQMIHPLKDVDGMNPVNAAKVFSGDPSGFAPCTPEAVLAMLDHYGIVLEGKRVVVIGRSKVVGRPLAMLLLARNATVTICHTRTKELEKTCREAEILIAAAGKANMVTKEMIGESAVVVDVGINVDADGNLCGDVDFEDVKQKASQISPVPKGVGSVTTSVLAEHVVRGAKYLNTVD
ncbi:MAG: bifunctional 5,10-methylenetetrahydrofolate dehydrogenase/5,10-methenyltetrahydrofolate cyclohydrolase [Coprococcus sp.]|nr:bifunctional 5,10-methylenetetrahydrofolate dehydrogenase/5,10-methenyltetrahydrofolate cyclohydrolase [Coprococcus sp.]